MNIETLKGKTVEECEEVCKNNPDCKAFEYGVNHGGGSDYYDPGDCVPQSSAILNGCDGQYWNMDLYLPIECEKGMTVSVKFLLSSVT